MFGNVNTSLHLLAVIALSLQWWMRMAIILVDDWSYAQAAQLIFWCICVSMQNSIMLIDFTIKMQKSMHVYGIMFMS